MAFTTTSLYGGAITAHLPQHFIDASTLRQIPDTQEVYLSRSGPASIVFDILERVERPDYPLEGDGGDEAALRFHLGDVVEGAGVRSDVEGEGKDGEEVRVWRMERVGVGSLGSGIPAYTLLATIHPSSSINPTPSNANATSKPTDPIPDFTALHLLLIRLVAQKTDLLISINVPHVPVEEGTDPHRLDVDLDEDKLTRLEGEAEGWMKDIVRTFEVREWGLFDAGDGDGDG